MSVKQVLQQEAALLHQQTHPVTAVSDPEVVKVIADLTDTMRDQDLVGLAAPQIGSDLQIFVTEVRTTSIRVQEFTDELRVFINPKLISASKATVVIYEGCGSCADREHFGPVTRAKKVTVAATDQYGKKFQLECDGLLARVIQHELDHLSGLLFPDRISDNKLLISRQIYLNKIKNSPEHLRAQTVTVKKITYLDH